MSKQFPIQFHEWLVPVSRKVLIALLIANVGVGAYFSTRGGDVQSVAPAQTQTAVAKASEGASVAEVAAVTTIPDLPPDLIEAVEVTDTSAAALELQPADEFSPRECRVWGPVSDPGEFTALSQSLSASGGLPEIQEIDVPLPPDFLVFVTELPSISHARQTAAALQELQIDNYVINREELGPGVAVGVFSRRELAERQREKVAGLGYTVAIEPMLKSQTAYNLVAHVTPESGHYDSSISACLDIAHNP